MSANAWLALWLVQGLGPRKILQLVSELGTAQAVLDASISNLISLGLPADVAKNISEVEPLVVEELERAHNLGVQLIDWDDPRYPRDLREVADAPPVLYMAGEHDFSSGLHLAFVGSRKASRPGKEYTEKLIKRIAQIQPDAVIVSGLALGIDGAAHQAALTHGLRTVAVMAGGLSNIYPSQHIELAHRVVAQGCLLTEFPCQSRPLREHFPIRNRIISGLCKGVVISEAGARSGASITANLALEQGREVFAFPGPPDSSYHKGTNRMIQQSKAKLIMDAEDLFEELLPGFREASQAKVSQEFSENKPQLSSEESAVLAVLEAGGLHQDAIAEKTNLPVHQVLGLLTSMELRGLVYNKAGSTYEASRS